MLQMRMTYAASVDWVDTQAGAVRNPVCMVLKPVCLFVVESPVNELILRIVVYFCKDFNFFTEHNKG